MIGLLMVLAPLFSQPKGAIEMQKAVFIDEKDAHDVPELIFGQIYDAVNNDGQLVDIYESGKFVGTYVVERFQFLTN